MTIFSGNILLGDGTSVSIVSYLIKDMKMYGGSRSDFIAALEELRHCRVESNAAIYAYDLAKNQRFPTLLEIYGRDSIGVCRHAVDMLEELLSAWTDEVT